MKILDFLGNLLKPSTETGVINIETYRTAENAVQVQAFALFSVINMISTLLTKCRFSVYDRNGEEINKKLWYMLNYRPNVNQNAVEFWYEAFSKFLYAGETLILQKNHDQLLIADNWSYESRALKESLFSEVSREDFTFRGSYGMSSVLFFRRRNADVRAVLNSIYAMYEDLLKTAAKKYKRSSYEKGILEISGVARGDRDFEKKFDALMNNYFKSYFAEGNKVLPLNEGYTYKPGTAESTKKYSNEVSDMTAMFEDGLARAAQAFLIPVSLIRGDVAGAKDAYNIMMSNCIDPVAKLVSAELTSKFFSPEEISGGARVIMDTKNIKHVDIFEVASHLDKLIAAGIISIDEGRIESGYNPLNQEWSRQHYITKNYTTAAGNLLEGGENENGTEKSDVGDQE